MSTFRRKGLRVLAPLGVAFLCALSPAAARAELEPGAEAPDVTAQEYINTEPMALADLKGRVILLELFSTT